MSDDARAVASALAGGRDGYRALFDAHRAAVERVAAGFPELDEAEARDLVLETFARAFSRLGALKTPARFGSWVLAIARQRCRSRLARKRDADAIAADLSAAPAIDLGADPGPFALDLPALVDGLSGNAEREAARLFFGGGSLTARQLAERVRLPPETVGLALERVRAAAKARLAGRVLGQRGPGGRDGPDDRGSPEHLDAEVWLRVLRGERFAGEEALGRHLGAGCPVCERFLSGLQETDGLDGEVDRALLPLEAGAAPGRGDSAFEQAMRRLQLQQRVAGAQPSSGGRARPSNALPLGLAACLALAGLLVLAFQRGPAAEPLKGNGRPELSLWFTVVPQGASRDSGEPGVPGGEYPEDQVVFLRYELASPGFVTLLRIGPDSRAEVLSQPGRVGSGLHELAVNGMAAGVSLRGFAGRNHFLVVASEAPLPAESLSAVFSAFPETGQDAPPLEQAHIARFELTVVPAAPQRESEP